MVTWKTFKVSYDKQRNKKNLYTKHCRQWKIGTALRLLPPRKLHAPIITRKVNIGKTGGILTAQ
jgi:hypothetical protein